MSPRRAKKDGEEGGMMPREQWMQTEAHRASAYSCARCGKRFETPHDFYAHMDEKHPRRHDDDD